MSLNPCFSGLALWHINNIGMMYMTEVLILVLVDLLSDIECWRLPIHGSVVLILVLVDLLSDLEEFNS